MLDIKYIVENPEDVKRNVAARNMVCDIDRLIELHGGIKTIKRRMEELNANINRNQKSIGAAKTAEERGAIIENGKRMKAEAAALKEELDAIGPEYEELMLSVPNTMAEDTPIGKNEELNVVVETFLEPTVFDFEAQDHAEIGKRLDLIDFEAGAKVAGNKFYFLKNEAVILDFAIQMYAIKKLTGLGFTPLVTPDLAKGDILKGSGFNPRGGERNIYNIEGMDLNLIATAEITVGGMLADTVCDASELPKKFVAFSHCFRTEAGAAGRAGHGLYRVHQFSKVEMYQFTRNEDGERALQEMLGIEKAIYGELGIPYRVIRVCSGDLGAPAHKKYDVEAWMPGKGDGGEYGEITSVGNFTNFQSRRLNIKYTDENGKRQYVNTLNGTASATGRTLLAILENFQQKDGSVKIPQVLVPYTGFDRIESKK
ncbi:MAG: serine--tRNA ligase [Clostridiales Family XIII bacterium]|jgi:seryl-tRNA synthetase|nr:serine--tRNA ligase [Clostridiales Family XIII bacterium]